MRQDPVASARGAVTAFAAVLVIGATCLMVFAGCTSAPRPVPATSTDARAGGYSVDGDGSVIATGYVGYSDLEGGFWALYDRPLGPSSAVRPEIIAVLLSGSVDQGAVAALKGAYVKLLGRVSTGVSVRMAGPEVFVDAIAPVTTDTPK